MRQNLLETSLLCGFILLRFLRLSIEGLGGELGKMSGPEVMFRRKWHDLELEESFYGESAEDE